MSNTQIVTFPVPGFMKSGVYWDNMTLMLLRKWRMLKKLVDCDHTKLKLVKIKKYFFAENINFVFWKVQIKGLKWVWLSLRYWAKLKLLKNHNTSAYLKWVRLWVRYWAFLFQGSILTFKVFVSYFYQLKYDGSLSLTWPYSFLVEISFEAGSEYDNEPKPQTPLSIANPLNSVRAGSVIMRGFAPQTPHA